MLPHIHIHRRSHHHRSRRRQKHRRQKIISQPMRKLRQHIRRRRSHHQQPRRLRLFNMLDRRLALFRPRPSLRTPKRRYHPMARDRRKRQRPHKLLRRLCHHHIRIESRILQQAHQLHRLVSRNPPAHPDRHFHSSHTHHQTSAVSDLSHSSHHNPLRPIRSQRTTSPPLCHSHPTYGTTNFAAQPPFEGITHEHHE